MRGPAAKLPSLSRRAKVLIGVAVTIVLLLLFGPRFVGIYTDWLWFDDLGYGKVFSTILWTRVALFAVFGALTALFVVGGALLAYRSRPVFVPSSGPGDPLVRYRSAIQGKLKWFIIIPAVITGLFGGLVAQGNWAITQMFFNGESFGVKDPQFGLDVGFYAFDLPMYRFVLNFLFALVLFAFFVNLLTHYVFGGIQLSQRGNALSTAARVQLAVLAGVFLLLKAVAYWFDRYSLLDGQRSPVFTGAGYTDINAVLPSKLILLAIAVICAAAFFAGIVLRDLRVPAMATVLMLLSALIIGVGWPLMLEQFSVKPNAAQKESEYIARNIEATRQAYGITPDKVTTQTNWTGEPVDMKTVDNDTATLSNIRVLDPNVISPAFVQRQQGENFYGFPDQLALDRYKVNGELRDFIVAVRELDPSRFEENQKNWINMHTVYTHGNGFVAAPANNVTSAVTNAQDTRGRAGEPQFEVSDLSNIGTPGYANAPIKVKQPRIYFGEMIAKANPDYAIVGSADGETKEYDANTKTYTYSADSGVSVGNWFNRAAFAIKFTESNFILSNAINSNSHILFNRDPRDRVKKAAPWLTVDGKSYPAVMSDGSIKWIVDGYTTLDNYPYSNKTSLQQATADAQDQIQGQTGRQQVNRNVAYVRNSVKATVDAYTGKVELYQFDTNDPVLKTWMKAFPGTVKPRADLDKNTSLRDHIRYPEDLFKIQRQLLAKYHVDDPQTFFRSNDFWTVPEDPNRGSVDQPPYYYVAADPKTKKSSFQLTTVMNSLKRPFLSAYITASSDPERYGQITIKELPPDTQTDGPKQANGKMTSDARVASDVKQLENTATVRWGNLLTLPVGNNGILNVLPMYTEAKNSDSAIPKLNRVVVQFNGRTGYGATIAEALSGKDGVGIDPNSVTDTVGDSTGPQSPRPSTPTTPAPSGTDSGSDSGNNSGSDNGSGGGSGSNPARDAAVAKMNDAMNKMKSAKASGDFPAYGLALDELQKAIEEYEKLPK